MTPIGSALVPPRRSVGSRAVVPRLSVEKSSLHQELERGSARPGRNVGVLGARGRKGGGRWVPGAAGLGGQGSARRRGRGVVRSTTTGRFLGEGAHEPIAPRRWKTSAGFDDIGFGLVRGRVEQRLRLRGHAHPVGGGGVGGHIGHEHRSPRGISETSRRLHHTRFDRRPVGFGPRGCGYHRHHRKRRGDRWRGVAG